MTRRTALLRAAQVLVAGAIVFMAFRALSGQWGEVRRIAGRLTLEWGTLLEASAIVIATYLVLIGTWRYVMNAMGSSVRFADAAYIWFVSALARYLGALFQVVALSSLARRFGSTPMIAAGSAVVMTVVSALTGFGVVLATGGIATKDLSLRTVAAVAVGAGALLAAPFVAPPLSRLASRLSGRNVELPRLSARAIWAAALGSAVTWVLYGLAFMLLTQAVLGRAPGSWLSYVSIYTTAYLTGWLGLVPVGVGVAEGAMVAAFALAKIITPAEALLVAVVSRLWRTVLEISPGLIMVAIRGRPKADPTDEDPRRDA